MCVCVYIERNISLYKCVCVVLQEHPSHASIFVSAVIKFSERDISFGTVKLKNNKTEITIIILICRVAVYGQI